MAKLWNFQKYTYFVVNMCVPGRPVKYHLYLRGNRRRGSSRVTTAYNFLPSRNFNVLAGKHYFCRRFSISGSSGSRGSGRTGRARYSEPEFLRKSIEVVRHCRSASSYATLLRVPRRISLGFAHSAAAAGNRRRVMMRTCPRPWAMKTSAAERTLQNSRSQWRK